MKKNLFKNRVFVGALCAVIAALICFVGVPVYNNLSLTRITVVRVKAKQSPIMVGTKITADMIETVEKGKLNLPANTETDPNNVVGKYATTELQPLDDVTGSKISKSLTLPSQRIRSLRENEQALTIAPNAEASTFAFRLLPNDIVTFYEVKNGKACAVPELTYVSIVSQNTSNGVQILQENQTDKDGNVLKPSTITFITNPIQAKKLIELNNNGNYYITLKYRGSDTSIQNKYLDAQNNFFNGGATIDAVEGSAMPSVKSSSSKAEN